LKGSSWLGAPVAVGRSVRLSYQDEWGNPATGLLWIVAVAAEFLLRKAGHVDLVGAVRDSECSGVGPKLGQWGVLTHTSAAEGLDCPIDDV
jgi:hypothetical protein